MPARGGNAIDATIGANLALGVVAPYVCGCDGDIFAIVRDAELHGYPGSRRSPAAVTVDAGSVRTGTPLPPTHRPKVARSACSLR